MTKLERLYDDLHSMEIDVNNFHFSDNKKSACFVYDGERTIALDRAAVDSRAEELVLLGEEYAHYETGTLRPVSKDYNSVQNRINRMADEARARRYNIEKLIPADELEKHLKGCVYADGLDISELAELLEVTDEHLCKSLEHYNNLGIRW